MLAAQVGVEVGATDVGSRVAATRLLAKLVALAVCLVGRAYRAEASEEEGMGVV